MIRNRVVISLPETIHRNSQCGGAPSRLSGGLGDEAFLQVENKDAPDKMCLD